MNEVYLVFDGLGEDRHVVGVFSDLEVAETLAADIYGEVEAWPVDAHADDIRAHKRLWRVYLYRSGQVMKAVPRAEAEMREPPYAWIRTQRPSGEWVLTVDVWAAHREAAIDQAEARRRALPAEAWKEGPLS